MIGSKPIVVLDACVLANYALCDTLLRLAEPPQLFEPKWSEEIIRETMRTLEIKLAWPNSLATRLKAELRTHFSEAWVQNYEFLIPRMTNEEKDRHVVAAAVQCGARFIITMNLRHFREEDLSSWGVIALHPQTFLIEIFRQEQDVVVIKLNEQAADRSRSLRHLLDILNRTVPDFVKLVSRA